MAEACAEIHRVLANRRRLLILRALEGRELSVSQIARAIGASLQSTSQHLRLLREHSMLSSRRAGQTVFYRLHQATALLWPALPPGHEATAHPSPTLRTEEESHDG